MDGTLKRYKVTTEITFTVRALDEDDARERMEEDLRWVLIRYDTDKVLSGYYEVEEVVD